MVPLYSTVALNLRIFPLREMSVLKDLLPIHFKINQTGFFHIVTAVGTPLFISALFSVCSFLASFLFAGMILYNKISGEYDVNGYAGIMFTITLMVA